MGYSENIDSSTDSKLSSKLPASVCPTVVKKIATTRIFMLSQHLITTQGNYGINNFMTLVILNLCFQIKFSKMKKICHLKRSATALRSFHNQAIPFPMMKAVPVTLAHTAVSKLQLSIITFHIMKCINSQPYVFGLQFSWKQRRY